MMLADRSAPVSEVLLGDLKEQLRQRGLVVWLDPDRSYTGFADALDADGVSAPVVRYRGSFAQVLRDAAPHAREVSPTPLVVHLPGLDETTVLRTPMLELAAAGHRWQRDLKALVTAAAAGRVSPDALARFLPELKTLEQADAWLADRLAEAAGGLSATLKAMSLAEIVHQLLDSPPGPLAARVAHDEDLRDLWSHLHRRTGLPERWWKPLGSPDGKFSPNDVAYALCGWALSVEYMHDPVPRTARAKILQGAESLPAEVVDACKKLAQVLRERKDGFYAQTADDTEARISEERAVDPASLGKIETFRFEEDVLLRAAISAIDAPSTTPEAWDTVVAWAEGRGDRSHWLQRDGKRKDAWRLVLDAARLAQAIAAAGPRLPRSLDLAGAMGWYTEHGSRVDYLHRVLEQDRSRMLQSELPEFTTLSAQVNQVRGLWSTWASSIATDFSELCRREGFLPEPQLQQRNLFEEVVVGGAEDGVTAYFMVDALRYEMGYALRKSLDGIGVTATLSARLAELPTVTEVGMNVLAPVKVAGKLRPVLARGSPDRSPKFGGFQVGEYRVKDPDTRQRAIRERVGGATCPLLKLKEVIDDDPTTLRRRIARARIVIVHSAEIDVAGEAGNGLTAFDLTLRQLRDAWLRLRDAGIRRFVFTADHGFLLRQDTVPLPHGTRYDPSRRHVVSPIAADHPGEVRVPLASLGYEGTTDFLMMPASLQAFLTTQPGQSFVHGGNSLQERVIPVLVVTSRMDPGRTNHHYQIQVAQGAPVPGMHRIQVTVLLREGELFGAPTAVDVALRPVDAHGVDIDVWVGNELAEGLLQVTVGKPAEVFFRLRGGPARKVAVEVACTGVKAEVVSAGFFQVEATVKPKAAEVAPAPSVRSLRDWLEAVENTGHRQVLAHLAAHGSITEPEVAKMLGSPTLARRFANALDALLPATAPLQVRVDTMDGVKRYVREDG
jgi:hypothetical protein